MKDPKQKIIIPELNGYFGSKDAAGTYQTIINQIPPFTFFYSMFLGNCAVIRNINHKHSAFIGYDLDKKVIDSWLSLGRYNTSLYNRCGIEALKTEIGFDDGCEDFFIYIDPPYLLETRKNKRPVYKHEMTKAQHIEMLDYANQIKCNIAISHYPCELYDRALKDWRKIEYQSITTIPLVVRIAIICN